MMNKISFEAGTRSDGTGINFLHFEEDGIMIYADVIIPCDDFSEDYGYLTMKKAVLSALDTAPENLPIKKEDLSFLYDGQEQYLEHDADVDVPVKVDMEIGDYCYSDADGWYEC